jgi:hypothetical protein
VLIDAVLKIMNKTEILSNENGEKTVESRQIIEKLGGGGGGIL